MAKNKKKTCFPCLPVSTLTLCNQMVGHSKFPSKEVSWPKK